MLCSFCYSTNHIFQNHIIYKQKVCSMCMVNALETIKKEKEEWERRITEILDKKLVNNDKKIIKKIFGYIFGEKGTTLCKRDHICLYCNDYINDMKRMSRNYYYFVCGDCLNM